MTNYPEKKFAASTVQVNYAEGPDNGPPLVLIHGIGGRWVNWSSVIDQFAESWHVYALDLRGHGDTGDISNSYRFIDYPIEDVEFLRNVVGEPAYVVGHSLGAVTASGVCAVTPELVAAAVLEDPPLYVDKTDQFNTNYEIRMKNLSVKDTAIELRKADKNSSDEQIANRAINMTKVDPEVWAFPADGRLGESWDPDAVLEAIEQPVLLMQASPDMGAAISDSEATHADDLLKQGRYVKWDDVGHGMHDAQPERFVQLVNAFFKQVLRKQSKG
ncbi:MAG: alpha/beta hydrolase [Chloroflexi bacterium]|jgi:pimeloyl-ACP methyl ester carboxylesterase|nr:alpha/beta hydrolase [Chloroflexota bacterium]MBT5627146.1 alpha/beta hydrolase [Chloroflexota bacterium]